MANQQPPDRPTPRPEPAEQPRREVAGPPPNPSSEARSGTVRPLDPAPLGRSSSNVSESTVRAIPMDEDATSRPDSTAVGTVRAVAMPKTVKPKEIIPQSFNDAQTVADTFREPKPVIVNMQNAERDLARRLIDFSSGLCYGLGGQMEKVAKDVYLLTPDEIEVADEDRDNY